MAGDLVDAVAKSSVQQSVISLPGMQAPWHMFTKPLHL
jgi:hypothetical protein